MANYNKFDISYSLNMFNGKETYLFINHKVAVLCWAKIVSTVGKVDVISFDSHPDFGGGFIFSFLDSSLCETEIFGSKLLPHLVHFSKSADFCNWNLLEETQNTKIVQNEHRYLTSNNDNFIDAAFMKGVIKDVHWYYLNEKGSDHKIDKCDDINGEIHYFFKKHASEFEFPTNPFILDIDLDFFTSDDEYFQPHLIRNTEISQYLDMIVKLTKTKNCLALTIALEPDCCGGIENCLVLCDAFERVGLPSSISARQLLEKSINTRNGI